MATIKDIAQELGISDATVSRAFTGRGYVSDKMKEKISRVAKKLNYTPNSFAVALRTRKSNIILLVVPNVSNPIYTELVQYIGRFASQDGYNVILCNTDENLEKEEQHMEMLSSGLVAGVILVSSKRTNSKEEYSLGLNAKNIILFNREIEHSNCDLIRADHYQGVQIALEHFCKLGYRRVGVIIGDIYTSVGRERYKGYMDGVEKYGLEQENEIMKFGEFTEEVGYRSMLELLRMENRPKAILICQNVLTKGCIRALEEEHVKVPNDVSIIGIDDISNGDLTTPKLTYIKQPLYEMSEKVYKSLISKIETEDEKPRQITLFPVELVIRESCRSSI